MIMVICKRRGYVERCIQDQIWDERKMDNRVCFNSLYGGSLCKSSRNLWPTVMNRTSFIVLERQLARRRCLQRNLSWSPKLFGVVLSKLSMGSCIIGFLKKSLHLMVQAYGDLFGHTGLCLSAVKRHPMDKDCRIVDTLLSWEEAGIDIIYRAMNRFIIRLKFFKVFFVEALIVEVFIDLAWVNINLHTPLYYLPHLQLITFIGVLNVSIKLFYQYDYCIPGLLSKYSILLLKLWLFIAYVVSFVSLAASVGLLIQDTLGKSGPSAWTGVAGVLQCVFVLIRRILHSYSNILSKYRNGSSFPQVKDLASLEFQYSVDEKEQTKDKFVAQEVARNEALGLTNYGDDNSPFNMDLTNGYTQKKDYLENKEETKVQGTPNSSKENEENDDKEFEDRSKERKARKSRVNLKSHPFHYR
ncbi:putative nitrate reductase [Capsicum annuum]|nr:putative nitrate reductase [Capsicum annuum]KAF3639884.1 putative nitrate reductase [Capsicum annuum]